MITFINEHLFAKTCEKKDGVDGRPDFYRTIVKTSMDVIDKKDAEKIGPRVVEHVLHTAEDNWNKENTQLNVKTVENRHFIRLNQKAENKYDANVFFIAIPYNGFVVPMERSDNVRIYKAFTVTIKDPIAIGDTTYKHVAYLIVIPNQKVVEEDGVACELEVKSYASLYEDDRQKTLLSTTTIEFYDREGVCDYEITTKTEESEPVNMDDFLGAKTFPIFYPRKRNDSKQPRKPMPPRNNRPKERNERGYKGGKKPVDKKDDKPVQNRQQKPKLNKTKTPPEHLTQRIGGGKSLEQMIRDAELDSGRPAHKRGKGKKGKKRR